MPGRNGTGPMGQGPMTGRAMGLCRGERPLMRRNYGRAMGMRNGFARGYAYQSPTKEDLQLEKEDLLRRIKDIDQALETES